MHNNKDFGWVEFHHGSDEIALCNLLSAPCYAKWPLYHVKWALLQDAGRTRGWAALFFPPLWSSSLSTIQQKREGERGGRNVLLNFFMNDFCQRRRNICVYEGSGEGDTAKAGCDHLVLGTQGHMQCPTWMANPTCTVIFKAISLCDDCLRLPTLHLWRGNDS